MGSFTTISIAIVTQQINFFYNSKKNQNEHPFLGCSRPEIPNGKVVGISPFAAHNEVQPETVRKGQFVIFSCNIGYLPEPADSRVRCVDERWVDEEEGKETFPTCVPGCDNSL